MFVQDFFYFLEGPLHLSGMEGIPLCITPMALGVQLMDSVRIFAAGTIGTHKLYGVLPLLQAMLHQTSGCTTLKISTEGAFIPPPIRFPRFILTEVHYLGNSQESTQSTSLENRLDGPMTSEYSPFRFWGNNNLKPALDQ